MAERMRGANKEITVVGAGFSGLVSAYFLSEAGYSVTVHERSERAGGLIRTDHFEWGWVEWAANGIHSSSEFESFCDRVGIELLPVSPSGKKRFIYRGGKACRWPLSIVETFGLLRRLPFLKRRRPARGESVAAWAARALGPSAAQWLVAPALQGIYAGNPETMSAKLVFGDFFTRRPKRAKPRLRGTLAPRGGMGELIEKTRSYLQARGVVFRFSSEVPHVDPGEPMVIATGLPAARKILLASSSGIRPESAAFLDGVKMVSLATVTLAYERNKSGSPQGFGCLFPRDEGFRSLGVLFESEIFSERSNPLEGRRLERWIVGGELDPEATELSDEVLLASVLLDRERFIGKRETPFEARVVRAKDAFPHYDAALLESLSSGELENLAKEGIFLIGNYTGKIGLSGIFEQARSLVQRVGSIVKGAEAVS
jgi:oxygen-dependent protoporphyrinogen oxidase